VEALPEGPSVALSGCTGFTSSNGPMTNRALGHNPTAPEPRASGVARERGFTLFEVSISTVLVTFGVVSVMMLLPSGLKAQQQARYQIHAACRTWR
jgi:hypothetical protein